MFKFEGNTYEYVDMSPNQTRVNERRMELPIAFKFIEEMGDDVIEIGNVTRHYRDYSHDVIDLYEKIRHVANEDVLTWSPDREYKGAVSVSTVEHTKDPVLAVKRITTFAKNILVTIPLGYFDITPLERLYKLYYMHRLDQDNNWEQTDYKTVKDYRYNIPLPFANAVAILYDKNV